MPDWFDCVVVPCGVVVPDCGGDVPVCAMARPAMAKPTAVAMIVFLLI